MYCRQSEISEEDCDMANVRNEEDEMMVFGIFNDMNRACNCGGKRNIHRFINSLGQKGRYKCGGSRYEF